MVPRDSSVQSPPRPHGPQGQRTPPAWQCTSLPEAGSTMSRAGRTAHRPGRVWQGTSVRGKTWTGLESSTEELPHPMGPWGTSEGVWGGLGPVLDGSGRQGAVTSASVTTLFLNRRSSSSSDEHLWLRSRKALESGTHPAPHTLGKSYLGWGWGPCWGGWCSG